MRPYQRIGPPDGYYPGASWAGASSTTAPRVLSPIVNQTSKSPLLIANEWRSATWSPPPTECGKALRCALERHRPPASHSRS